VPPHELRPDVPPELEAVCLRCLAKAPSDRYPSAKALAEALQPFHDVVSARPQEGELPCSTPATTAMSGPRKPPWRRIGLAAAVLAAGVLLAVVAWQSRLGRREGPLEPGTAAKTVSGKPDVGALKIMGLRVEHSPTVRGPDGKDYRNPVGALGEKSFVTWFGDGVTVEAELSRPAYAYVIAYRPDGTEELCFPEREDEPPPLETRPRYPTGASRGKNIRLTEGTGLAVFAVVASSKALPSYRAWHDGRGESPWGKFHSPAGVVWVDDGTDIWSRTAEDAPGQRGKDQAVEGKSELAALTDWLRKAPEVEAVTAVGFTVLPRKAP
jgi:hypothetical protein